MAMRGYENQNKDSQPCLGDAWQENSLVYPAVELELISTIRINLYN